MQPIGWQRQFLDLVQGRDTIVCYGNVKDRYVYRAANRIVSCSFCELIALLLAPTWGDLHLFDSRDRLRRLKVQADTVLFHRADGDVAHLAPYDEYTANPNMLQDVTALLRALTAPLPEDAGGEGEAPIRVMMVDYAATMMSQRPSRTDDDEMRILLLRKMIDDLAPGRKLILVYLLEEQIPRELYLHAPSVALFEVPLPARDQREAVSRNRRLPDELVPVYANLTDGLSLSETDRILEDPQFIGSDRAREVRIYDVEQAIKRFKFGERPDYYEQLSVAKLERAKDYFINGIVVNNEGKQIERIPGVRGQDEAVEAVSRMLWRAKANVGQLLRDPGSLPPRGVLFLCGPSGTGKTMLAKRLARFLFDSEEAFTRFDMSEYMQDFAVTRLIGAPPGYVGSERGGQLTNAVREKPFSVLLFDETEKAHPRVLDIFLQILSDGRLTDSRGHAVFFSETIIVFTSNIGMRSQRVAGGAAVPGMPLVSCPELGEYEALVRRKAGREEIRQHFVDSVTRFYEREISRPELLNRFGNSIIPFQAVEESEISRQMFASYLQRIEDRFEQVFADRRFTLSILPPVLDHLNSRHADAVARFGGRAVINALEEELLTEIARAVLSRYQDRTIRFTCRVINNRLCVEP